MNNKSMLSIIMVIIILLVTKLSGLFRDAVVVSVYGASLFSDGFFLALSLVLTLYALIGKAITLYLIPKFNQSDEDYSVVKSFIVKSSVLAFLFLGSYHLLSDAMIRVFYTGIIDMDLRRLFTSAVYASIFVSPIYSLVAYHQSKNRFYITTLIGLAFNVTLIVSVLIKYSGIYIFLIGMMFQLLMLLYRVDLKKLMYAKLHKVDIKAFFPISAIAITMAFEQLNVLIDRKYISTIGLGELTLLDLGSKVSFMFMGIVVLGVTTVIYPKLNQYYAKRHYKEVLDLTRKAIILMLGLSVVGIAVLAISAEFIVKTLFVRGELYVTSIDTIVFYLKMYSIALLPLSIREIMARFMILRGKEFYLLATSLVGLGANIYISLNATTSKTIIYGSLLGIGISAILLAMFFIMEVKLVKVDNN